MTVTSIFPVLWILSCWCCAASAWSLSFVPSRNGPSSFHRPSSSLQAHPPDSEHTLQCPNALPNHNNDAATNRRRWLANALATAAATATTVVGKSSTAAFAADELPSRLRDYTKLAPLGPAQGGSGSNKAIGIAPEELARRLAHDLTVGAHDRGGYFLSGDLSPELFLDDCVFEDPTNRVQSLSQYQKALTLLFDPNESTVELLGDGLNVVEPTTPGQASTITGRLRSRGTLKVAPWRPYVKAYETTLVYTLDPATGLVARQDQAWTKGAGEALTETFSVPLNGRPPSSSRAMPAGEPRVVTDLFDRLNGRRPSEYSAEERVAIETAIEAIVRLPASTNAPPPSLAGTWVLVYLQQGPGGAGIDRRLPFFPEFDFNDSFQVFSEDASSENPVGTANRVTNVGQVLGAWADVRVAGSLREVGTKTNPQRFEAQIEGGTICFGAPVRAAGSSSGSCPIDLPMIQGTGIFDSLYLGERLRIGQNINGGGARVVQIRL